MKSSRIGFSSCHVDKKPRKIQTVVSQEQALNTYPPRLGIIPPTTSIHDTKSTGSNRNPYNLHKLRKCIPPNCHPYFRILTYDPPPCFPPWIPTRPLGQVDALQISTHGIWCMFGGDHTLPSSDQKRHRPGLKCKPTHNSQIRYKLQLKNIYIHYTTYLNLIEVFFVFGWKGFSTRSVTEVTQLH